jgi:hypothetical protein
MGQDRVEDETYFERSGLNVVVKKRLIWRYI